jgi:hypothetical protein
MRPWFYRIAARNRCCEEEEGDEANAMPQDRGTRRRYPWIRTGLALVVAVAERINVMIMAMVMVMVMLTRYLRLQYFQASAAPSTSHSHLHLCKPTSSHFGFNSNM